MLVTGRLPDAGGGKPQRIVTTSRTPSFAVRTTGASWSGKIAGSGGWLPVRSRMARVYATSASRDLVIEYRLHTPLKLVASAAGATANPAPRPDPARRPGRLRLYRRPRSASHGRTRLRARHAR